VAACAIDIIPLPLMMELISPCLFHEMFDGVFSGIGKGKILAHIPMMFPLSTGTE
jgi:nitrate/nitrite transporter NarK